MAYTDEQIASFKARGKAIINLRHKTPYVSQVTVIEKNLRTYYEVAIPDKNVLITFEEVIEGIGEQSFYFEDARPLNEEYTPEEEAARELIAHVLKGWLGGKHLPFLTANRYPSLDVDDILEAAQRYQRSFEKKE